MHRVTRSLFAAPLALASLACGAPAPVVVEVLPPRTSVTCAAPAKTDPALGRGLLDVVASLGAHSGYVSDLRLSLKGANARVTGVELGFEFSGDNGDVDGTIDDVKGLVPVGDVVLDGEDGDLRVAVLENVPLVPRDLAVAIQEANVGLSKIDFESLNVSIKPEVDGVVQDDASTFTVDVCAGCLTQPPDACSADGENKFNPIVCRPGQDIPSFTCLTVNGDAP